MNTILRRKKSKNYTASTKALENGGKSILQMLSSCSIRFLNMDLSIQSQIKYQWINIAKMAPYLLIKDRTITLISSELELSLKRPSNRPTLLRRRLLKTNRILAKIPRIILTISLFIIIGIIYLRNVAILKL